MKQFLAIALLLLCLCGCSPQPEPSLAPAGPTEPVQSGPVLPKEQPEEQPDVPVLPDVPSKPVYLFEGSDKNRILTNDGTVVLESDQALYLLQNELTGTLAGLVENTQEGIVYDDYGWAMPEQIHCTLYDLQGQPLLTLPWHHISLYGDWIYGSHGQTGDSEIRRLSDGAVLFTDVHTLFPTGGILAFRPDHENNPQVLLLPDGSTMQLPPLYSLTGTCTDSDGTVYLVVQKSQLTGLMSLQGDLLVDCRYKSIPAVRDGTAYCANTFSTDCIRLSDGQILQTWPVQATAVYSTCAVALQGNNWEQQVLVDLNGQLLYPQAFTHIYTLDLEMDGRPELFRGMLYHQDGQFFTTSSVPLLPDGTVLGGELTGDWEILSPRTAVLTERIQEESAAADRVFLKDLQTDRTLGQWEGKAISAYPLYHMGYSDMDPVSQSCFLLNVQSPAGWSLSSLVAPDGTVLLEQLSHVRYRGGGVLQVRQGFTEGLIRTDGTWLYQQSRFSTMEE